MRKFSRLPFSPHYKFKCLRDFNYDGKDYKSGEPFPEDGKEAGEGLLFKLYDQRRIEPIPPEATIEILEDQTPPDETGGKGDENPPNQDGEKSQDENPPNGEGAQDEKSNDSEDGQQTPPDETEKDAQGSENGPEQSQSPPAALVKPYTKIHKGFGRYDVLDAAGIEVATDLKKAEAELLVAQNAIG